MEGALRGPYRSWGGERLESSGGIDGEGRDCGGEPSPRSRWHGATGRGPQAGGFSLTVGGLRAGRGG